MGVMMKVNDFLNLVLARENQGYIYGAYFDRIITEDYIQAKAAQYPDLYTPSYIQRSRSWIGHYAGDCVGLIKQAYWTNTSGVVQYGYLGRADLSANGMLQAAQVKGPIITMPNKAGIFVHSNGHIGVFIGDGEVIEARGVNYGVVITNLWLRPWTSWGYVPYITDYDEYTEETTERAKVHIWPVQQKRY
jgi:hypothetical protein